MTSAAAIVISKSIVIRLISVLLRVCCLLAQYG
jgi:hypothetical protein